MNARKSMLFRAALVLLLCSLAGNYVLFRAAREFYTREARFRLEPVGEGPYAQSGDPAKPSLLLLGDSRIYLWKNFPASEFYVTNAGVGNETTAQIRLRTEQALEQSKPKLVVIQAGINDLKAIPLLPQRRTEITNQCVENLMDLVAKCHKKGAKVLLMGVLPAGKVVEWSRKLVWSDAVAETQTEVTQQLARRCEEIPGVLFLDLSAKIDPADYTDTLHFTPAFYEKIQSEVQDALQELLKRQ